MCLPTKNDQSSTRTMTCLGAVMVLACLAGPAVLDAIARALS